MTPAIDKEWWRDLNSHYPPYLGHLNHNNPIKTQTEIDAFLSFVDPLIGSDPGQRVLDLCCGPGGYAIALARKKYKIWGIDINQTFIRFIREAVSQSKDLGQYPESIVGDMRKLPFKNAFGFIYSIGTSFGFFDDQTNSKTLQSMADILKPNGTVVLDCGNRDFYVRHLIEKDWIRHSDNQEVTIVKRRFDILKSRMEAEFETFGFKAKRRWSFSWRAYSLTEMIHLLEDIGLQIQAVYGNWYKEEFSRDSKRIVLVCKKKGQDI